MDPSFGEDFSCCKLHSAIAQIEAGLIANELAYCAALARRCEEGTRNEFYKRMGINFEANGNKQEGEGDTRKHRMR